MTLPTPAAAEVSRIVDFVMNCAPVGGGSRDEWLIFRARLSTMLRTFGEDCLSGRFAEIVDTEERDRKDAAGDAEFEARKVRDEVNPC